MVFWNVGFLEKMQRVFTPQWPAVLRNIRIAYTSFNKDVLWFSQKRLRGPGKTKHKSDNENMSRDSMQTKHKSDHENTSRDS